MYNSSNYSKPCVSAFFLCTDSLIGALRIVSTMVKETAQIQFYSSGIIVEVLEENAKAKIEIHKSDMHHYVFNNNPKTGAAVECYCVDVDLEELAKKLKSDKKACIILSVYMKKTSKMVDVCITQENQNYCVNLDGKMSYDPYDNPGDIFKENYENDSAVSIFDNATLKTLFTKFKGKDYHSIEFCYRDGFPVTASSKCQNVTITLPHPEKDRYLQSDTEDERETKLVITQDNICQILGILKLGLSNTIKVYLKHDAPLIFRSKISNYGVFELLINEDII